MNNRRGLVNGCVYVASDGADLLSSIEVSSDDSVSLDKGIQLLLQVLVLLSQKSRVLLESFQFSFELYTSIHQSLVREDYRFKIGVETSLVNLKRIILRFKILELSGIFVGTVIFITILLELDFLLFNQSSVGCLVLINFDVESMNHGLQLGNIGLSSKDT